VIDKRRDERRLSHARLAHPGVLVFWRPIRHEQIANDWRKVNVVATIVLVRRIATATLRMRAKTNQSETHLWRREAAQDSGNASRTPKPPRTALSSFLENTSHAPNDNAH
jgi:hypothetical protein